MERHKIKFSKSLKGLEPYVQLAARYGVPIHKLRQVRGFRVRKGCVERQLGACIEYVGKNTYDISIIDAYQNYTKPGKMDGYIPANYGHYGEQTLLILAHELSHMVYWNHTADRLILEARLYLAFTRLAKKRGYQGYK